MMLCMDELLGHDAPVTDMVLVSDLLWTSNKSGLAIAWDTNTGLLLHEAQGVAGQRLFTYRGKLWVLASQQMLPTLEM